MFQYTDLQLVGTTRRLQKKSDIIIIIVKIKAVKMPFLTSSLPSRPPPLTPPPPLLSIALAEEDLSEISAARDTHRV